jgi:hypothetical protein
MQKLENHVSLLRGIQTRSLTNVRQVQVRVVIKLMERREIYVSSMRLVHHLLVVNTPI